MNEISVEQLEADAQRDREEMIDSIDIVDLIDDYLCELENIKALEERLDILKRNCRQFETTALLSFLDQIAWDENETLSIPDGYMKPDNYKLIRESKIEASIPQSRAEEAYKILYDLGYRDKCKWVRQLKVHPQTLLKIVRDLVNADGLTPEISHALGVYIEPRVKVAPCAEKKQINK